MTDQKEPERGFHPYTLYIGLTLFLFVGLLVIGKLALENGWVPVRESAPS